MKYTTATSAVLVALSSLASAQVDFSSIPPCAASCVAAAGLTAPGCQQGDIGCACRNESWIGGISCCLVKCTPEEQSAAIQLAQTFCGTAGVTVPSEVSCPSASSAAAEPTTAADAAPASESSAAATTSAEEEESTPAAGAVADVVSSASSVVSSAASSASSAVSSASSAASSAAAAGNGTTTRPTGATGGAGGAGTTSATPATFSGAATQLANGLGLAGAAAVIVALF